MRHWLVIAAVALAMAFAATACGGDDDGGAAGNGGAGESVPTVEAGLLTVGSDIPFPPFEYREGGELTGFDVVLVEEMADRLGLRVKWVDTAFDTIFTQLAGGRYDVVASATTITEERKRQVDFTDPYYAAQQSVVVNARRTPTVDSVEALEAGDTVAVQRGTTGEIWARENLPDGVRIRGFPEAPDTYTALEGGNVTAVIFDEPSAVAEAEEREALEVVQALDTGERYGFAVNPRNDELLRALNDALAEIKDDGTYQRFYDRFEGLPPGGNVLRQEDVP
jgi:polar amino acid transport system substrate-binding protein